MVCIQERFSQGDLLRIAELQEEVYALKQGSQSVTDYFTQLKSLWEELDNYRPMTPCTCPSQTYHKQDFIIRFLKGLDERFSVVRSQVLLLDPLPSVNRVFSMVIQHERQLLNSISVLDDQKIVLNSADTRRPLFGRGRGAPSGGGCGASNKLCTYCGRTGHTIDVCYGKHGYPPGHPRFPGRPRFHDRGSGAVSINSSVVNESENVTKGETMHKDALLGPQLQLTPAQRQSLLALLQPT